DDPAERAAALAVLRGVDVARRRDRGAVAGARGQLAAHGEGCGVERLGQGGVLGAGGVVAAETVARAEPDGHTLFLMSNGTAVTARSEDAAGASAGAGGAACAGAGAG